MRFVTDKRLAVFSTLLVALVLCVAFVGNAFAATVQPHISVNHTHAVTDVNGCATFKFSGSGFTESTNTITNAAVLILSDQPFFDQDAVWGTSTSKVLFVPVDKEGKFSASETICDPFVTAPDHWTVASVDFFTGLPGNSVNLLVD